VPENVSATPVDASGQAAAPGAGESAIDINKLAEKVYRLLLADARLSGARSETRAMVALRVEI